MWRSLFGTVLLEIQCADTGGMLEKLTKWNITIIDLQYIDDLTVMLRVTRSDYRRVRLALSGNGCKISVKGQKGIYWKIKGLLRRPIFTIGVSLYLFLIAAMPGRVFFVQIEGNSTVPDRLILETAQACGISFGANRREVRSERMKNELLEKIPQLQWAGINTYGCVAVISVQERKEEPKRAERNTASIVASRDAIIRQITVLRGTQLCKVGQAVKAGQTLVSAYKDYGLSIKITGAKAEIYGQTEHDLEVATPVLAAARTAEVGRQRKCSIILGKKQINFFKDSGISGPSCVKMYKKTYLTLPGGYVLPVAWVTYEYIYYDTQVTENSDFSFLGQSARDYLMSQMSSGRILQEDSDSSVVDGRYRFLATYSCYELIGLSKNEELMQKNE